jgi:hypothetical protein
MLEPALPAIVCNKEQDSINTIVFRIVIRPDQTLTVIDTQSKQGKSVQKYTTGERDWKTYFFPFS